jgi:two-component system cell cycle sensor histidine kinase/response regulator CckA
MKTGLKIQLIEEDDNRSRVFSTLSACSDARKASPSTWQAELFAPGWIPDLIVIAGLSGETLAGILQSLRQKNQSLPILCLACRDDPSPEWLKFSPIDFQKDEIDEVTLKAKLDCLQRINHQSIHSHNGVDASASALGRLANDWGNQLMGVQAALGIIEEGVLSDSSLMEQVAQIRSSIDKSAQWIRDISVLTTGALIRQPVEINSLVDRMMKRIIPIVATAIDIRVWTQDGTWPVIGDPEMIDVALTHLVTNAIEAMGPRGSLRVMASNVHLDKHQAQQAGTKAGDYVRVMVEDDGHGIPPDLGDKVFEPFFTTRAGGSWKGLGLTQAQLVAGQHGGVLDLVSQEGVGSRFTFLLARAFEHDVNFLESRPDPYASQLPSSTFLIVDDAPLILELISRSLQADGHKVYAAEMGLAGLELFRRHHPSIDFVILDINLLDTTGIAVAEDMLLMDPQAKIIYCTGFATLNDLDKIASRNKYAVLRKPFSKEQLLSLIGSHFPGKTKG